MSNSAPGWHRSAACRGTDPALFFPSSDPATARGQTAAAKRLCSACPVAGECLAYAVTTGERHGTWGGLTAGERRRGTAPQPQRAGGTA